MTIFSWDKTALASGVVLALAIETQVLGEELAQNSKKRIARASFQIPRSVVLTIAVHVDTRWVVGKAPISPLKFRLRP